MVQRGIKVIQKLNNKKMKNILSKFGELNAQDFIKGAIIAVLGAVMPVIESVISTGSFQFDWKLIGTVALSAFVAYMTKNLFTNSKGDSFSKE